MNYKDNRYRLVYVFFIFILLLPNIVKAQEDTITIKWDLGKGTFTWQSFEEDEIKEYNKENQEELTNYNVPITGEDVFLLQQGSDEYGNDDPDEDYVIWSTEATGKDFVGWLVPGEIHEYGKIYKKPYIGFQANGIWGKELNLNINTEKATPGEEYTITALYEKPLKLSVGKEKEGEYEGELREGDTNFIEENEEGKAYIELSSNWDKVKEKLPGGIHVGWYIGKEQPEVGYRGSSDDKNTWSFYDENTRINIHQKNSDDKAYLPKSSGNKLYIQYVSSGVDSKKGDLLFSSKIYEYPIEWKEVVKEKVSEVTATPREGEVKEETKITLSTTTEEAEIYYVINDDAEDIKTKGTKYEAPIVITQDKVKEGKIVIRAIGVKEGFDNSEISTFEYTIAQEENIVPPVLNWDEDKIGLKIPELMFEKRDDGATIYYTWDGSQPDPNKGSRKYEDGRPFVAEESGRTDTDRGNKIFLKAIAVKGDSQSEVMTREFTLAYRILDITIRTEEGEGYFKSKDSDEKLYEWNMVSSSQDKIKGNMPTPTPEDNYIFKGWKWTRVSGDKIEASIPWPELTSEQKEEFLAAFEKLTVVAPINADPSSGEVEIGNKIKLSTETDGAVIKYGINEPGWGKKELIENGTEYLGPITIKAEDVKNGKIQIRAIGVKDGLNDSDLVEFNYTVKADQLILEDFSIINGVVWGLSNTGKTKIEKGVINEIIIPSKDKDDTAVTEIKSGAFNGAIKGVKKVVIQEGIRIINTSAFFNNDIEEVELPSSIMTIASQAFQGNKLSEVRISGNVSEENLAKDAFDSDVKIHREEESDTVKARKKLEGLLNKGKTINPDTIDDSTLRTELRASITNGENMLKNYDTSIEDLNEIIGKLEEIFEKIEDSKDPIKPNPEPKPGDDDDEDSDRAEILTFSVAGVPGVINTYHGEIHVNLPYYLDVSSVIPLMTLTKGATVSPSQNQAVDLRDYVYYTVKGEGLKTTVYRVNVTMPDKYRYEREWDRRDSYWYDRRSRSEKSWKDQADEQKRRREEEEEKETDRTSRSGRNEIRDQLAKIFSYTKNGATSLYTFQMRDHVEITPSYVDFGPKYTNRLVIPKGVLKTLKNYDVEYLLYSTNRVNIKIYPSMESASGLELNLKSATSTKRHDLQSKWAKFEGRGVLFEVEASSTVGGLGFEIPLKYDYTSSMVRFMKYNYMTSKFEDVPLSQWSVINGVLHADMVPAGAYGVIYK